MRQHTELSSFATPCVPLHCCDKKYGYCLYDRCRWHVNR